MTTPKTPFVIFFVLVSAISACVKNTNTTNHGSAGKATLTLSKSTAKRGEQINVLTSESNPAAIVKWTTTASGSAFISPAGTQAAVMFALAGNYTITAGYYLASDTLSAYDSSSSSIQVTDSIYSPSAGTPADSTNLTSNLVLIPVSASDSGLIVLVQTVDQFDCTSYLTAYSYSQSSSFLSFDFSGAEVVLNSVSCGGIKNPATVFIFFPSLPNGTYPVSAMLNQVTYQGTVTVTDTYYTFGWNYSSGVTISPLQIKRQ